MKKRGKHYVIGDVHGCYDELMLLLQKIEEEDSDAQILFVGDFIDRGPRVWDVLEWAMKNITENGKYQSVRGNHEQMVLDWYQSFLFWWEGRNPLAKEDYIYRGPKTDYDFWQWAWEMDCMTPEKLAPIMKFFESLPYEKKVMLQGEKQELITARIVHAWTCFDFDVEEPKKLYLWMRSIGGNYKNEDIVIHGHTPTISSRYASTYETRPGMISFRKNAVNVDCGCCFSESHYRYPCMLGAVCLETMEEIYPMTIKERFLQIYPDNFEKLAQEQETEYKKMYCEKQSSAQKKMQERLVKED